MVFWLNKYIVLILLILSVKSDITTKKIPNKLTFPVILWGFITSGVFSGLNGILFSLGGFLVGLAVFLIPFSMGGIGAGDVKLMAAVGSLMGWKLTVYSALLTAVAGGIIVIGYTIYKGYFLKMLRNIGISIYKKMLFIANFVIHNEKKIKEYNVINYSSLTFEKTYIPYGVAIAIGTTIVLIGNHIGYPPFI